MGSVRYLLFSDEWKRKYIHKFDLKICINQFDPSFLISYETKNIFLIFIFKAQAIHTNI